MNTTDSFPVFAPGQRWISEAEPELGLGILVFHDKRTLTLDFPGGECTRQYSLRAAPVRRMTFKAGDRISTANGKDLTVDRVIEDGGIMTYIAGRHRVEESRLAPFLSVSLPQERLIAGLAGQSKLFDLRAQIRTGLAAYESSPARGFLGGQIDLIPHQVYIADQVSRRFFPRVLLSDETGLGKTIEAGLILHRLLVQGQISRILIIVPDALVHQWFIEFYRKFSLTFRLFDEDFCRAAEAAEPDMNPFNGDQQGICSQSFIRHSHRRREQILSAGWDMVVMDEAHHITEDPEFYAFMRRLGTQTTGLMLLTATPEQMGIDTHFAQLQLLDPDRYYDRDVYLEEAKTYEATADKVTRRLAQGQPVDALLDTFGPGRVVFRNRRKSIKGFPGRKVYPAALTGTQEQVRAINRDTSHAFKKDTMTSPAPRPDLEKDPRVVYLAELTRKIKPEKILVICASLETAKALESGLKAHVAVDAARFDETMTLLQRDRNAAWFAKEDGARLLICSEIGSEGRNFQFVHHLFLFDLPLNPELLEQRIGRVDRIGQKHDISIHVPYVKGSSQEILARWYADGIGLFKENINGLHAIFTRFEDRLTALIKDTAQTLKIDETGLARLISEAAAYTRKTQEALDRGRHILVELNSFKPGPAEDIIRIIRDTDEAPDLKNLMEILLDHYGVDMDPVVEKTGEQIISLTVDRITDEQFPALPGGSRTVTFDRATAIAREELGFITWDHGYVNQVMDFFLTRGEGCAAVAKLCDAGAPGLILECLFVLEIPELDQVQGARRFVRTHPIHIRVDHTGTPVPEAKLPQGFHTRLEPDHPAWFMDMEAVKTGLLPELLDTCRNLAENAAGKMRRTSLDALGDSLGNEIHRLTALKKVNPDITDREIEAAEKTRDGIAEKLASARLRLDAVRLVRLEA
ncbi:MAG TPA: RNA polymerase-binding ATPase [Desulfobacteraceae bacterium]|nr:RNA polymerase-binding ATPase [Desulfobacteraceae bacterium]